MVEIIRVTLFDGSHDDTVMTVPAAVEWLQDMLDEIPEEYRDQSVFRVEKESGYYDEGDRLIFTIYYDRPETEEEASERQAQDRARRESYQREVEARERAEFERLKAKFDQSERTGA